MSELQEFQGTWQAVWLAMDGHKGAAEDIRGMRVTVAGNAYVLRLGGQVFQGVIAGIDPAETCGAIDF